MNSQTWRTVACKAQPDTFERFISALKEGADTGTPDFAHAQRLQRYLSMGFDSHARGCWVEAGT